MAAIFFPGGNGLMSHPSSALCMLLPFIVQLQWTHTVKILEACVIGSGNGLAPNRQQTIWANDALLYGRICVPPCLNELTPFCDFLPK